MSKKAAEQKKSFFKPKLIFWNQFSLFYDYPVRYLKDIDFSLVEQLFLKFCPLHQFIMDFDDKITRIARLKDEKLEWFTG